MPVNKKKIRPLARLHGYWLYKRFLGRTQHWTVEQKRGYVLEKLRQTLIQAQEGCPFYRDRFRQAGFDPTRDFRSVKDLGRIPLLTKADIRMHGEEMIDRRFARSSVLATTSGTTGEPMRMQLSEWYVALDYACMFRHWAKGGYSFRAPYAAIRSYVPSAPGEPLWKYNWWQNTLYMSAYHLKPDNSQGYIDALARFQPVYLRGYPSSLNVLAEYAYDRRAEFRSVRGVFTASETLLPSERETIERTFGRTVFDWYGMTEPAVVITEKTDHSAMEVEWEYGFPEFLSGPELAQGERRLVATSLHNPVMPFIRYDTGDIVVVREDPGESGDYLYPAVTAIRGRKDECLLAADGQRLPSLNFYSLLQEYAAILRFQFVQPAPGRVVVRVSLRPSAPGIELMLRQLEAEFRKRLGPDFALEITVTDQFICGADGKTPTFARLFQTPETPVSSAPAAPTTAPGGTMR